MFWGLSERSIFVDAEDNSDEKASLIPYRAKIVVGRGR